MIPGAGLKKARNLLSVNGGKRPRQCERDFRK